MRQSIFFFYPHFAVFTPRENSNSPFRSPLVTGYSHSVPTAWKIVSLASWLSSRSHQAAVKCASPASGLAKQLVLLINLTCFPGQNNLFPLAKQLVSRHSCTPPFRALAPSPLAGAMDRRLKTALASVPCDTSLEGQRY